MAVMHSISGPLEVILENSPCILDIPKPKVIFLHSPLNNVKNLIIYLLLLI